MPTIEVKGSGDRARALHQAIPGENAEAVAYGATQT
jgi:hypothetical protein